MVGSDTGVTGRVYGNRVMIPVHHQSEQRIIAKLPPEAKRVTIQGKECWMWQGRYYRRHRDGYERFHPYQ